jgi:hypothetical protein
MSSTMELHDLVHKWAMDTLRTRDKNDAKISEIVNMWITYLNSKLVFNVETLNLVANTNWQNFLSKIDDPILQAHLIKWGPSESESAAKSTARLSFIMSF